MENTIQITEESIQKCFGLLSLPLEEFMQRTEELLAEEYSLNEGTFWQDILNSLEKESIVKYMFALYRMAETELLQTVSINMSSDSRKCYMISEMIESCVRTGRVFYEALYRPECFSEKGIQWMPVDCRYNDILVRFLDGGKRELSMLLDAAKLRPEQVPVIKAWLAELAKK